MAVLYLFPVNKSFFRRPLAVATNFVTAITAVIAIRQGLRPGKAVTHEMGHQVIHPAQIREHTHGVIAFAQLQHTAFVYIDLERIGARLPETQFPIVLRDEAGFRPHRCVSLIR
jgi:hypothetical protein